MRAIARAVTQRIAPAPRSPYQARMDENRTFALASAVVVVSGVLWGVYWAPVRQIEAAGPRGLRVHRNVPSVRDAGGL